MLHATFLQAFERLLSCRRTYDGLDRAAEPLHRLAAVRAALDEARDEVRRARIMHHPEVDEIAGVGTVVHCDHLATLVHVVTDESGRSLCACGEATESVGRISR